MAISLPAACSPNSTPPDAGPGSEAGPPPDASGSGPGGG
jgi:hypothetical protein